METYYKNRDIVVRRAYPSDVDLLANRLRKSDIDEVWASNNLTPWEAMHEGMLGSNLSLTITKAGLPIGIFGINPESVLGKKAIIWFLGSDDLDKIKYTFVKQSRGFIKMFLSFYPYLYNYVDVRNKSSIEWLEFCGAKMNAPAAYGVMGYDFIYFWFER